MTTQDILCEIRCPSFEEPFLLRIPSGATVSHVKSQLTELVPTNPPTDEQRLIYYGKLLYDEEVLSHVWRPNEEKHTLHLVLRKEIPAEVRSQSSSRNASPILASAALSSTSEEPNVNEDAHTTFASTLKEDPVAQTPDQHPLQNLTLRQVLANHQPGQDLPMVVINGYVYRIHISPRTATPFVPSTSASIPVLHNQPVPAPHIAQPQQPVAQQQGLLDRFIIQPLIGLWNHLFGPVQELDGMEPPQQNALWLFIKYALVMGLFCSNATKSQIAYYGAIFGFLFFYELGWLRDVVPAPIRRLIQPRVFPEPAPNPTPQVPNGNENNPNPGETDLLLNVNEPGVQQPQNNGRMLQHAFDVSTTFVMSLVPSLEPVHGAPQ